MKIPNYTATPGLDRFPERERFAVYRAAHKKLMVDEAGYKTHWTNYFIVVVCVSILPMVVGTFLGFLVWFFLQFSAIAVVVFLSFRHQKFVNQRIGEALLRDSK